MSVSPQILKDLDTSIKALPTKADFATLDARVKKVEEWGAKAIKNTEAALAAVPRDHNAETFRGFKTPREFMTCVMDAYTHGEAKLDPRLTALQASRMPGYGQKTVGSDEQMGANDAYGGFLVPPAFSPDFLKRDPEMDPMGQYTRKLPMERPIIKIPARTDTSHTTSVSGGLTVGRREETVAATASRMQIEQITLEAHTLMGLAYATEELLMDSPSSFAALIADGFSEQLNYAIVKERITGTGVGQMEGVLNTPCLVSIAKESGQAAATLVYQNVLKMRARCWGYSNAIWIANHDTTPQLITLNQPVGLGGAVMWQPSAREDRPDMLLGRPIFFSEYAKTLGASGDLILCNWKEYLEGLYQPQQQAESVHVRFVNHERAFKVWLRNCGKFWWRAALTPVNSTATLSPAVVLDARS